MKFLIPKSLTHTFSFLDISSYLIYTESNYLFLYNKYGSIKINIHNSILIYRYSNFLYLHFKSLFFYNEEVVRSFYLSLKGFLNSLEKATTSLSTGYRAKYRVVGLGWKAFYFKNNLFIKLGYSHLVFMFVPFNLKSFKKKKKKKYHTVVGADSQVLNLFFETLKNLRISDIYSMNGIFDRECYVEFREGKKSFFL